MRTTTPSTFPSRPAKRLTIALSLRDHAHHRSLMMELMKRARHARLSGATAFEAHEGYGASGQLHRAHLVSDDRPAVVVIVDRADRVDAFLLEVADLLEDVLVVMDDVDIVDL